MELLDFESDANHSNFVLICHVMSDSDEAAQLEKQHQPMSAWIRSTDSCGGVCLRATFRHRLGAVTHLRKCLMAKFRRGPGADPSATTDDTPYKDDTGTPHGDRHGAFWHH